MPSIRRHLLVVLALTCTNVAHAQEPCGTWDPVPLPSATGKGLVSVSASSATDAWAVWKGLYHWNGTAWSEVAVPGLVAKDPQGYADTLLAAVAAVAPNDAWIVGNASFLGTPQTLTEHWNGASWNVVPSPVISGGSGFDAVDALAADDAWAVGFRAGGLPEYQATSVTLTAHWNGSQWTAVPSPNVSNRSHRLEDVTMISPNDVWAVGYSRNLTELYKTLILHWNGTSWSITPSPNFPNAENFLYGVSGTAANDVWAVGSAWDGVTSKQIFLHWNGSSWSKVEGPGGPTACVGCTGDVLALGPDDVWAAGSTLGHWDGTQWSLVPNPQVPGAIGIALRSLAKIGPCDAWAVGSSFTTDDESGLAVRLNAGGATVNQPPVAVASADPASGPGPLEVHFSSAGSVDPDGSIVSYAWNFGDSSYPPNANDPNPVHTFLQTGPLTYHVTLVVRDDQGAIAETSVEVRITPPLHVESQVVSEVNGTTGTFGRDVVVIDSPDPLPLAGATVTARHTGPTSGIVTGTTDGDGRVVLETSPVQGATETGNWCFEVIDVAKSGCIYAPGSNVVTVQCESGVVSVDGAARSLAVRVSPNPTHGDSRIELALPASRPVHLTIVDPGGRRVREVFSGALSAGVHLLRWDGRDDAGRLAGAGIYFVTLAAGEQRITSRILRLP